MSRKARVQRGRRLAMIVYAQYPLGEPRVQREALAARDAGCQVEVVCARGAGEPLHESVDGIGIYRIPVRHLRGAATVRTLFQYFSFTICAMLFVALRHSWRRYWVVQVHAPPDFLVAAGLVPKLAGAKLVLDIHDLSPHMAATRYHGRGGRAIVGCLTAVERFACAYADAVLTVHEPYRGELLKEGVRSEITCVMNGPDERLIDKTLATPRPEQDDRFLVAYHGTINRWYGVDLVVEAISKIRGRGIDAHGLVLGEGDALREVRELAQRMGIAPHIELSGQLVPIEEALARVMAANCGVIPNRPTLLSRFALSTKLLEYVALGVPVVVARLEVLAASFGPEEVTFFDPGDAESLSEALHWVACNPAAAAEKANRARSRGVAYSWRDSRRRYLEALGIR
jgi:glycosyltransferase involved in cell wall biosynthesis